MPAPNGFSEFRLCHGQDKTLAHQETQTVAKVRFDVGELLRERDSDGFGAMSLGTCVLEQFPAGEVGNADEQTGKRESDIDPSLEFDDETADLKFRPHHRSEVIHHPNNADIVGLQLLEVAGTPN